MIHNDADIYVGGALKAYGEYGEKEGQFICSLAKAGDIVIDVGANYGVFTVQLARKVGKTGGVYAIEPQRLAFQAMCGNLALNSIMNVRTFHAAAGARLGTINVPILNPHNTNNIGGVSLEDKWKPGDTVPVLTLDSLSLNSCSLIKIDVEGMELDVLKGGWKVIKKFKPILYVENDRQQKSKKLLGWLFDNGYRIWWHTPSLFNEENFNSSNLNIFGPVVSHNVVCVHKDDARTFDLPEVKSTDDWWA